MAEPAPLPDKAIPRLSPRPRSAESLAPTGSPERVIIDAIGVDAELVDLGLQPDGAMEVPDFGAAGWYREGPPPGHPGPAVVAAHVDSRSGPDVFFRLRELAVGDRIEIRYDAGDAVTFRVVSGERVPKDDLPGDRIWPVTDEPLLTLITCGGEFDRSVRHYRDNVLVYAVPEGSPA
jgi:sortase (surface protein transpeptidase)